MILTLLTRAGCHLCEEMAEVVRVVGGDVVFRFEEVDVDGDAVLRERYGEEVPVLLINGRPAFKYELTTGSLRRRLAAERRRQRMRWLRGLVPRLG
jgi:Glutaredoxin-like domain (DUF836)